MQDYGPIKRKNVEYYGEESEHLSEIEEEVLSYKNLDKLKNLNLNS